MKKEDVGRDLVIDVTDASTILLPVEVARRGHSPVYENGSMIVLNCHAWLYTELGEPFTGPRLHVPGDTNTSGVVIERKWWYDKKRANDSLLNENNFRVHYKRDEEGRLTKDGRTIIMKNICVELWYRVMFHEGLFWARFDWVDTSKSIHHARAVE